MPYHRRRRRRSMPRQVIRSYKKVLNFAPTARAAAADIFKSLSVGTDSLAAGQTGVTDAGVPTGCLIKFFEIQFSCSNLVNNSLFMHTTISLMRSGQVSPSPLVVGGNPLRNQVHHQSMFNIGGQQNSNHVYKFNVPAKFQRVREGDTWFFGHNGSQIYTDAAQVIYKFYQ